MNNYNIAFHTLIKQDAINNNFYNSMSHDLDLTIHIHSR